MTSSPATSRRLHSLGLLLAVSAALAACGGSDSSDSPVPAPAPAPVPAPAPAPAAGFTQQSNWTVALPASGQAVCYDFDARAEAVCTGTAWDVKLVSGGRSASLYTNSGPSSNPADSGRGGAFGTPFTHTWEDLLKWPNALTDASGAAVPAIHYTADSARSVFSGSNSIQSAAFEYNLTGTHQLFPNFRVFLITTDASSADITGAAGPVFALQLTGYYGGPAGTTSGWPSFRWVNTAQPAQVHSASVDATSGWVYYDLARQAVSSESGPWHIAFNRYQVKLNGGASGDAGAAGFLSTTPAGFYDADGQPITAQFTRTDQLDATLPALTSGWSAPRAASAWVSDSIGSMLSPAYTGAYPGALNFGFYTYYPTDAAAAPAGLGAHQLRANPEAATLVRSGSGDSYARMRLTDIRYASATPAYTGQQTWTFEFHVQPAAQ